MVDMGAIQDELDKTYILAFDIGQTRTGVVGGYVGNPSYVDTIEAQDVDEMIRWLVGEVVSHHSRHPDPFVLAVEHAHFSAPNPRMFCELCQLVGTIKTLGWTLPADKEYVLTTAEIDSAVGIAGSRKQGTREVAKRLRVTVADQHQADALSVFLTVEGMHKMTLIERAQRRKEQAHESRRSGTQDPD